MIYNWMTFAERKTILSLTLSSVYPLNLQSDFRNTSFFYSNLTRADIRVYTHTTLIYCIHSFKWRVCWHRHSTIRPLASQYLWPSDVEDTAVHLNKWCWNISPRWSQECAVRMRKQLYVIQMFTQGNHIQKIGKRIHQPHSLANLMCLQFRVSKVSAMSLLPVPSRRSFGLFLIV